MNSNLQCGVVCGARYLQNSRVGGVPSGTVALITHSRLAVVSVGSRTLRSPTLDPSDRSWLQMSAGTCKHCGAWLWHRSSCFDCGKSQLSMAGCRSSVVDDKPYKQTRFDSATTAVKSCYFGSRPPLSDSRPSRRVLFGPTQISRSCTPGKPQRTAICFGRGGSQDPAACRWAV